MFQKIDGGGGGRKETNEKSAGAENRSKSRNISNFSGQTLKNRKNNVFVTLDFSKCGEKCWLKGERRTQTPNRQNELRSRASSVKTPAGEGHRRLVDRQSANGRQGDHC